MWKYSRFFITSFTIFTASCTEQTPNTTSAGGQGGTNDTGGQGGLGGQGGGVAGQGGSGGNTPVDPVVIFPRTSIQPSEVAILINDDNPLSVEVGAYYKQARAIPDANVIHLRAGDGTNDVWAKDSFNIEKAKVDAATPANVQAFVVTWSKPYIVECMSVVSAFALGFDVKYCKAAGAGCQPSEPVAYYNTDTTKPWDDFKVRPTMMLSGTDATQIKAYIDRGVKADGTFPKGDGYFVRTTDTARSVRYFDFQQTVNLWNKPEALTMNYVDNSAGMNLDYIENKTNVLFYLTGLADVPSIATNQYLPGAVADHLTSYGGQVPNSGQMSIQKWLDAGATASCGTVVEPCNYQDKFSQASVLVPHYFRGETVLEAYWKSVHTPGEANFVGEPLAKPWGSRSSFQNGTLTIETTILWPGKLYDIQSGPSNAGPWTTVMADIQVPQYQFTTLTIADAKEPFYQLVQK